MAKFIEITNEVHLAPREASAGSVIYHGKTRSQIVALLQTLYPKVTTWEDVANARHHFEFYYPFEGIRTEYKVNVYNNGYTVSETTVRSTEPKTTGSLISCDGATFELQFYVTDIDGGPIGTETVTMYHSLEIDGTLFNGDHSLNILGGNLTPSAQPPTDEYYITSSINSDGRYTLRVNSAQRFDGPVVRVKLTPPPEAKGTVYLSEPHLESNPAAVVHSDGTADGCIILLISG